MLQFKRQKAFTLAEVLITLSIIGVVAAITIPTLMQNMNDNAFRVAYKRAYSDMSQAFEQAIQEHSLSPRSAAWDIGATDSEWAVLKGAFKVAQECTPSKLDVCWQPGDVVCNGCGGTTGSPTVSNNSDSFVDASGRSWARYNSGENIYLIDTNGAKPPNKFGKDRWMFSLSNVDNTRTSIGFPAKVVPFINQDMLTKDNAWCQYPPCYYQSWLFNTSQ